MADGAAVVLPAASVGQTVTCEVTARNANGTTAAGPLR